jgi:hypothetical protein
MQSSSFENSTIAWRRTPHTPIIQSIENMIRRSSTPDVSQTSLSIYQFKSALSRKSVPPCLHIVPASLTVATKRSKAIWVFKDGTCKLYKWQSNVASLESETVQKTTDEQEIIYAKSQLGFNKADTSRITVGHVRRYSKRCDSSEEDDNNKTRNT